ncbi:MAG: hypothetical protein ABI665_20060, partial [Vicinamibacterales bacterium]
SPRPTTSTVRVSSRRARRCACRRCEDIMLRIDRVNADVDVRPAEPPLARAAAAELTALDPQLRERIKELVREALSDHLRELERRGVV